MRLGIRMILVLLIVLALRYLVPPLLGLLMPFALALVVAWVLNPLVKSLQKRLGLSRGVLSLLLILLAFAVAGGILFGLGHSLVSEISSLIDNWEGIWESLQGGILTIGEELDKFLAYLPDEVETFVNESLDGLNAWLSVWVNDAMVGMGTRRQRFCLQPALLCGGADCLHHGHLFHHGGLSSSPFFGHGQDARRGPRFLLPSQAYRAGGLRGVCAGGGHHLHRRVCHFAGRVPADPSALFRTAGRAAGRSGLYPHHRLGTVMVPWAVIDVLTGNWVHAVGLMVVWGIVCVFLTGGGAKAVGSQTGLSPILSLVSMYVGMRLAGVLGMILGPVLCLVLINVCRTGIFDGLLGDLRLAVRDTAAILNGHPARRPPAPGEEE